jgi:hypothetical protein
MPMSVFPQSAPLGETTKCVRFISGMLTEIPSAAYAGEKPVVQED